MKKINKDLVICGQLLRDDFSPESYIKAGIEKFYFNTFYNGNFRKKVITAIN